MCSMAISVTCVAGGKYFFQRSIDGDIPVSNLYAVASFDIKFIFDTKMSVWDT